MFSGVFNVALCTFNLILAIVLSITFSPWVLPVAVAVAVFEIIFVRTLLIDVRANRTTPDSAR